MSQKRDELLRVIGSAESNNNPNIMVGGKKVPLTDMTVGERDFLTSDHNVRVVVGLC